MAVVVRARRLSNPSRRRVKARNPKKRMSLKQKLHFGTARQRAAARLSLRGRKNPSIRKTKKAYKKRTGYKGKIARMLGQGLKHRKGLRRRKNVGEIVSISLAGLTGNPGRKRRKNTGMAKARRRRARKTVGAVRRRRRVRASNPAPRRRRRVANVHHTRKGSRVRYRRTRRRNPTFRVRRMNRGSRRRNPFNIEGVTSGILGQAVGVIAGAVGSKYLTQLALGGNNTGIMGYGGNLVAAIALGWASGKVTKSKSFGQSVMVGGLAALVLRVISDNTAIGQYVNLSLSGAGKGGDTGLGIIQDSSFPTPQTFAPGSMTNAIVPRATRNYVSAQVAQTAQMKTAGSGMGAMRGRNTRRAIM